VTASNFCRKYYTRHGSINFIVYCVFYLLLPSNALSASINKTGLAIVLRGEGSRERKSFNHSCAKAARHECVGVGVPNQGRKFRQVKEIMFVILHLVEYTKKIPENIADG